PRGSCTWGIGAREKYRAKPPRSTTTLTTLGLASSEESLMRRNNVVITIEESTANGATASPIAPGSISGSSAWTFTTTSQSRLAGTSARRSVPVSWARVRRTFPPNEVTLEATRKSSVATRTCETIGEANARRYTCSIIGRPSISASTFPGSLVEPNLAGMTATTCRGNVLSTAAPVDAACTTDNNTTEMWRVTIAESPDVVLDKR